MIKTSSNLQKNYPKDHLIAAIVIVVILCLSLLTFPSTQVEAHKATLPLANLDKSNNASLLDSAISPETSQDKTFVQPPFDTFGSEKTTNTIQADQKAENPLEKTQPINLSPKNLSVTAGKGDTLSGIFNRAGIAPELLQEALAKAPKKQAQQLKRIKAGQLFTFDFTQDDTLQTVTWQTSALETIRLAKSTQGYQFNVDTAQPERRKVYKFAQINSSLYQSAVNAGVPKNLIGQMADIFAYNIDFSKIAKGDQFELLFEEKIVNGKSIGTGEILAARFTTERKTYTAILHTDGRYYNEQGFSLRKAFLRTPVDFARISSRFSIGRKHPILNKIRAHQGVDYAAPRGTPVRAAGDGKVTLAGRKGGYGNTVVLQHGSTYKTLYAHMQGFAKGISPGVAVKQGQIIGYIGTTGLSTGPHLHYEFLINGQHVDPLKQKQLMPTPMVAAEKNKFLGKSSALLQKMTEEKASQLASNEPKDR